MLPFWSFILEGPVIAKKGDKTRLVTALRRAEIYGAGHAKEWLEAIDRRDWSLGYPPRRCGWKTLDLLERSVAAWGKQAAEVSAEYRKITGAEMPVEWYDRCSLREYRERERIEELKALDDLVAEDVDLNES